MKRVDINLPTLALVAATRGMLGAGAGLLLSEKLPYRHRRQVGWTLLGIGVLSTIPLALEVLSRVRASPPEPRVRHQDRRRPPDEQWQVAGSEDDRASAGSQENVTGLRVRSAMIMS